MQQNLVDEADIVTLNKITYLVGSSEVIQMMLRVPARKPFHSEVAEFLNDLSKHLLGTPEAKKYADIVTLGFWIRKSSIMALKNRFMRDERDISLGRGIVFHVAPSNVPVNYMYSLVAGLITGNANVVRVSSKDFPQVRIINEVLIEVLKEHENMKPYICLVRYGRNQEINDVLSAITDVRIIWGGDNTIADIRKSPLKPRATEVTFADRYSFAVINSETYLSIENKERFAEEFYNDTFLTDQNACTSPRLVVWTGSKKQDAKKLFWDYEHKIVERKYIFQPIMGINKLTSAYLMAVACAGTHIESHDDNMIVRVNVQEITKELIELKDNSGYFFEYDCDDIKTLQPLCDDSRCQTIAYLGEIRDIIPLIESGLRGVDRVVPIGKTMDFDLIWDGYNLYDRLTRKINVDIKEEL